MSTEHSAVERFDEAVDRSLDRLRGDPLLDRTFYAASELGNFSLIWFLLGAAKALNSPDRTRELTRIGTVIGLESLVVNQAVKRLFDRKRPMHEHDRPHRLRKPTTSSFPSGHASAAFAAAALLSEDSRLGPLYYGAAAVVATSRAYVRVHHASDVLGGAAVGIAFGALARRAWPRRRITRATHPR